MNFRRPGRAILIAVGGSVLLALGVSVSAPQIGLSAAIVVGGCL